MIAVSPPLPANELAECGLHRLSHDLAALEPVRFFYSPRQLRRIDAILAPEVKRACVDLLRWAPLKDRTTGDYPGYLLPAIIKNMRLWIKDEQAYCSAQKLPEFEAEIVGFPMDVGNLRGLNLALSGKPIVAGQEEGSLPSEANQFLGYLSYRKNRILGESVDGLIGLRMGGDEFCPVGLRVKNRKYKSTPEDAIKEVNVCVHRRAKDFGLDNIQHPKHMGDPAYRGVYLDGVSTVFDNEHSRSFEIADKKITEIKQARAGDRRSREGTVVKDLRTENPSVVTQLVGDALDDTRKKIRAAYRKLDPGYFIRSPYPFAQAVINRDDLALRHQADWMDAAVERRERMNAWMSEHNIVHMEDLQILENVQELSENMRRVEEFRTEALGDMLDRYFHHRKQAVLRHQQPQPVCLLVGDMKNATMLNSVLKHHGADYYFQQLARRMDRLQVGGLSIFPGGRGFQLATFVKNVREPEMNEARTQIVGAALRQEMESGFIGSLNQRHPDRRLQQQGAKLYTAVVQLQDFVSRQEVEDAIAAQLGDEARQRRIFNQARSSMSEALGVKAGRSK